MRRPHVPRCLVVALALVAAAPACNHDEVAAARASERDDVEQRAHARLASLRAVHAVIAAEPMLIHALAQAQDVSDADRAHIAERLQIFQTRIDEADNAIESLAVARPEDWATREVVATHAMKRAEEARLDAWESLLDSDRTRDVSSARARPPRTSMR